jgi:hypothetical protein
MNLTTMNATQSMLKIPLFARVVGVLTLGTNAKGDLTMSDTMHCDWVWQDTRDGYHYWTCNEHGCIDSEPVEEYLDGE